MTSGPGGYLPGTLIHYRNGDYPKPQPTTTPSTAQNPMEISGGR